MSFDFMNPLMLIGLAGISLPLLAHLLSKKKYDIEHWGAMQFLELGRNARRKIRLEELLLMLLRMGLIALLAIALARPWASGGFLSGLVAQPNRDVVIVIDGSYSMGWEGKTVTPHAAAIQWAHRFLEDLQPGDSVALLDARDQVRPVIESPVRDFGLVREQLDQLPSPAGSSDLAEATTKAVQILSRTSNLVRQVVVITDGQARGWSADDENRWARFDDLCQQPAVKPQVWVVNVQPQQSANRANFSLDRLQIDRELTVVDFPVRVKTKVRYSGGTEAVSRRVFLEIDGQRISEKTLSIQLQPGGEASVEFEYRFGSTGSHLISVVLDQDNLPGDNRAGAAVAIADALPLLVVDGDPQLDAVKSESFFVKAALSPGTASADPHVAGGTRQKATKDTSWVHASVVKWNRFESKDLANPEVVMLANVPRLTDAQVGALTDFVNRGGGLIVALGDKVDRKNYNQLLFNSANGLLPASLESIEQDTDESLGGVHAVDASLELPWLARFRADNDGGFIEARFSHWWNVVPAASAPSGSVSSTSIQPAATSDSAGSATKSNESADVKSKTASGIEPAAQSPRPAIIAARLNTSDPLLVLRRFGRGDVALLTSAVDADWSTLPAKPDFVAFMHELIFQLASGKTVRNVDVGMPLTLPVDAAFRLGDYVFAGPGKTTFVPQPGGDELRPLVRLNDTRLPGVYSLHPKVDDAANPPAKSAEQFVVNFDRGESDLTVLAEDDLAVLEKDSRTTFIAQREELTAAMAGDESQTEFWYLLLFVFLGILVGEVVMTRRLVRGGHETVEGDAVEKPNF